MHSNECDLVLLVSFRPNAEERILGYIEYHDSTSRTMDGGNCEDKQGSPRHRRVRLRRREGVVCWGWEPSGFLFQTGEGSCEVVVGSGRED